MNKEKAVKILEDKLNEYRKLFYKEVIKKVGEQENFEEKKEADEVYQIECEFFIDDEEDKTLRVVEMVSYSLWRDFAPITSDFIIAPSGKFIGE